MPVQSGKPTNKTHNVLGAFFREIAALTASFKESLNRNVRASSLALG